MARRRQPERILVVGGARCVWDDLNLVPAEYREGHVMCVNDMGMYYPGRFQHWYSNDNPKLKHWYEGRRDSNRITNGRDIKLHSSVHVKKVGGVEYHDVPIQGSSGLAACYVALLLGYTDVLMAGIPFDDSGHFYDPPLSHWTWQNRQERYQGSHFLNESPDRTLKNAKNILGDKVTAVSGRWSSL
tara:strand:- start:957 stop:1514 length:558 start_codon:yes stop_codon:yes gene_type:complete